MKRQLQVEDLGAQPPRHIVALGRKGQRRADTLIEGVPDRTAAKQLVTDHVHGGKRRLGWAFESVDGDAPDPPSPKGPDPASGFVYERVPKVSAASLAYGRPPEHTLLVDRPLRKQGMRQPRLAGPFRVESLPTPLDRPGRETNFFGVVIPPHRGDERFLLDVMDLPAARRLTRLAAAVQRYSDDGLRRGPLNEKAWLRVLDELRAASAEVRRYLRNTILVVDPTTWSHATGAGGMIAVVSECLQAAAWALAHRGER